MAEATLTGYKRLTSDPPATDYGAVDNRGPLSDDVSYSAYTPRRMTSESEREGSAVSFSHLNYSVQTKVDRRKTQLQILFDVSGVFEPGMNAIMGPTGSGKTTLLDLLAMRKEPEGMSGQLLLNGCPLPPDFRLVSGYVVQDDVVMGTLTVRENLQFSANLRLRGPQRAERRSRVNRVIAELGLEKCADTFIGTQLLKGVSGGERKRCNIGMELITQPSILFLDEPTTGLDSTTAYNVMCLLKGLSEKGRTIIFSIHQPRFSIYQLFDKLHLMSKGSTVYHGNTQDVLPYFSNLGLECDEFNNPPDFFLDIILKNEKSLPGQLGENYEDATVLSKVDLASEFRSSEANLKLMKQLEGDQDRNCGSAYDLRQFTVDYPTNFFQQVFYISGRLVKNVARNRIPFVSQVLTTVILGMIMGGVYWQIDLSLQSGMQNRLGAMFFVTANCMFSSIAVIVIFVTEKPLFLHESANGYYRISSYFISKMLCDVMPLRTIPTFLFATVTYWMFGFQHDPASYFLYFLTLYLDALASVSIGLAISVNFNVIQVSQIIVTTIFVFFLLFAGLFINVDSIVFPINYLQYTSVLRYSMKAIEIKEFVGLEFCGPSLADPNVTQCISGTQYLSSQGIQYESQWDYWQNPAVLAGMCLVFLVLTYVRLRSIKKLK